MLSNAITIRPIDTSEIAVACNILFQAFYDKFSFMFPNDLEFGRKIYCHLFNAHFKGQEKRRILVAIKDGKMVGVVDIHFKSSFAIDRHLLSTLIILWRRYGLFQAVRNIVALLNLIVNPVEKGTAYISTIAVKPEMQDQKIGLRLMLAAVDFAAQQGYRYLTLYIITRNKRGIHLYRKLGFEVVYIMQSALFQYFNGFYGTIYMKKELETTELPIR